MHLTLFDRTIRTRRLLPVVLVGLMVAAGLGATVVSAIDAPPECAVAADSLGEAKDLYADTCELPRIDCDRIDGVWYCSSRVIGRAAPGGVTVDDVGASDIGNGGTIVVTTASTIAPSTTVVQPTTTAGPSSTIVIDPTTTTAGPTSTVTSTTGSTTTAGPTTTAAPTTTVDDRPRSCGVVAIEAESLDLVGDWRVVSDNKASGGRYITWEGLSPSRNNGSPDDVLTTTIEIDRPGSYRFVWAMRQPDGVESDKANDSWLNLPDAARFGPVGGGEYPGFIKVFGNSKGDFAYRARADVNHVKSTIAIDFDRAGTYTLQIAGRSHGHQIDRIVLHHESISQGDAIAGRAGDCDGGPTTTTAPPTTVTTTGPTTTVDLDPDNCPANTSGQAALGRDLISLHYDHAPDRDDGHATVAGKEVATRLGFAPWVIGGAYGADNARTYNDRSEAVMDATWGRGGWINADADWAEAVRRTADRWQGVLVACGDIWIAEGGQSDLSADVVRELKRRMPGLDTERRIHLVQHSQWNENMALDADLRYVKDTTDYIRIPDGNNRGNGTADFNDEDYNGPFLDTALNGPNAAGWRAAFDYYPPRTARLDFSDTVELLEILDINTDRVNDIEDFADVFMR